MAYHKPTYLFLFLPILLLIYQIAPRKFRRGVLLGAGYLFFWSISGKLVLYLIGTTIFTHYIGICLELQESRKKKRLVLAGGVLLLLGVLGYLKYYNFFAENISRMLEAAGSGMIIPARHLLLPIGISFYTLQAISYIADVYWKKIPAEKNLMKLALFLGFFPQIMEGPISTYGQTAEAIFRCDPLRLENLSSGAVRILWGLFKKIVIADRLYTLVQAVFDNHENFGGVIVFIAATAYTAQLYMEFSGCIDIVIGSARMFGVRLPENFRQPFASRNAAEFWRRWHITLGEWFKAYVFFPVSVSGPVKKWNRYGRKKFGKYITKAGASAMALFPVWLGNGLWHGARWSYIFFGMYYFAVLMAGIMAEPVRNKIIKTLHINEDASWFRALQIGKTWIIIIIGEMFFRANGLRAGIQMFQSMFGRPSGNLMTLGLDTADYVVILYGCAVVGLVGILRERNLLDGHMLRNLKLPVRWAIYYGLILAVLIFGAYGVGYQQVDLIYAGF
ncbi:MAG: MBOAT family O-acyltransferase [Merdimonas faecis]|uniref:MBOAT family O-acyltransferase n=1 Tax=Merdimonas faecis TaxID=1653435 RepID=UPI00320A0056